MRYKDASDVVLMISEKRNIETMINMCDIYRANML